MLPTKRKDMIAASLPAYGLRISVEFRGELHSLERVFYKWMRCELVHDGGLPVDLQFNEDAEPDELSVCLHGPVI